MKFSWNKATLCALVTLSLIGCSPMHRHMDEMQQTNAQNLKAWDDASSNYMACNKPWQSERRKEFPVFNEILVNVDDPRYLQSLTSKSPVSKAFKDGLLKFRPDQLACRKELLANLGEKNVLVSLMYKKAFQAYDAGVVDILDGRLKTMGEVNRKYVQFANDANEARIRLRLHMESRLHPIQ